jgi:hypothetical protein
MAAVLTMATVASASGFAGGVHGISRDGSRVIHALTSFLVT